MDVFFILSLLVVALGFGFVVFWHELGHFLAAKWAGVRVEQFAVGFGSAIVSYRKGLGFRFGTSYPEYQELLKQEREGVQRTNVGAISPTEYRLNWVPLGGYVKMYGQEDMVASTTSTDDDHYMNKTVGQRMVIISAGVVMNVILAAILFTLLFFVGYHPPAAVIGHVVPGRPADRASLAVGDKILEINGQPQYAWMNVAISTALLKPGVPADFTIQPAGTGDDPAARRTVQVIPDIDETGTGMVNVGIERSFALQGINPKFVAEDEQTLGQILSPDSFAIRAGERVVEVAGQQVGVGDWWMLRRALQSSEGRPVSIRVETNDKRLEDRQVMPRLTVTDAKDDRSLAGLLPLVEVASIQPGSPNVGKLMPGDVIEQMTVAGTADTIRFPSLFEMREQLKAAGERDRKLDLVVRRAGEAVTLRDLEVTLLDRAKKVYGLGFGFTVDTGTTQLGGIRPDSPAAKANVADRGRLTAVDGQPVNSWFDAYALLRKAATAEAASTLITVVEQPGDASAEYTLPLSEEARAGILAQPIDAELPFVEMPVNELKTELQTRNPLQALWWGVRETRDQILQLYLTLKRVAYDRTVPASNLTGPLGIFQFGTIVAQKGPDWLIWFLAMISANLAVVNFLPIPILDGGHMVFLASEKITGKPPSPKVQTAALYAGLVMIVALVLFVTYNDIQRLPFM